MNDTWWIGWAMIIYLAAALGYMIFALTDRRAVRFLAMGIAVLAFIFHSAAIISRIILVQRLPLSNTYETLVLFSWVLVVLSFWLENRYRIYTLGAFTFCLVFISLATTSLPQISSEPLPLLPALKSNWLLAHVLTCFVAYAAFGVAFATSLIYLLVSVLPVNSRRLTRLELLDNVTYRAITLGYPLLTVGIVTGAIWAQICWGRYWSWDPKETWSLITWIIYGICLHLRHMAGWQGRWAAWSSIAGFLSVIFTYLGVNYLFSGLHSYAS